MCAHIKVSVCVMSVCVCGVCVRACTRNAERACVRAGQALASDVFRHASRPGNRRVASERVCD